MPSGTCEQIRKDLGLERLQQIHTATCSIRKSRKKYPRLLRRDNEERIWDFLDPITERLRILKEAEKLLEKIEREKRNLRDIEEKYLVLEKALGNRDNHQKLIEYGQSAIFQARKLGRYAVAIAITSGFVLREMAYIESLKRRAREIVILGYSQDTLETEIRRQLLQKLYPETRLVKFRIEKEIDWLACLQSQLENIIRNRSVLFFVIFEGQALWTSPEFLKVLSSVAGSESKALILGDHNYEERLRNEFEGLEVLPSEIPWKKFYLIDLNKE